MRRRLVFDALWGLALVSYIVAGMPLTPFHGDEATQLSMSGDFYYRFIARDLEQVTYSDPPINPTEQHLRLLNGSVAKYLAGLAWYVAGYTVDDLNEQWDWSADWTYNQANGHAPSDDLLLVARVVPTLLLAGGAVVIFTIGMLLGGRQVAYVASLFYALNPALLVNGRRAMMEGGLTFFSLLVVLAGIGWVRRRRWGLALLLGIAAGLAVATKHTGVLTVAAVLGACGLYLVVTTHRSTWRGTLPQLMAAGVVALVVFYWLNPVWWGAPVARAGEVLTARQDLLAGQTATFGGYADRLDQLAGFLRQAFLVTPQYYEVDGWDVHLSDQIARYEASPWTGVRVSGPVALIWGGLVLLGAWRLLRDGTLAREGRWIIGLWTSAMVLSTWLLTPLEWQRYYLPVYPALSLLGALGAATLLDRIAPLMDEFRHAR